MKVKTKVDGKKVKVDVFREGLVPKKAKMPRKPLSKNTVAGLAAAGAGLTLAGSGYVIKKQVDKAKKMDQEAQQKTALEVVQDTYEKIAGLTGVVETGLAVAGKGNKLGAIAGAAKKVAPLAGAAGAGFAVGKLTNKDKEKTATEIVNEVFEKLN